MKLGKIITLGLLGGAGYVAYRIYQNREQIHEQIISTEDTVDAIATDLENIKKKSDLSSRTTRDSATIRPKLDLQDKNIQSRGTSPSTSSQSDPI